MACLVFNPVRIAAAALALAVLMAGAPPLAALAEEKKDPQQQVHDDCLESGGIYWEAGAAYGCDMFEGEADGEIVFDVYCYKSNHSCEAIRPGRITPPVRALAPRAGSQTGVRR